MKCVVINEKIWHSWARDSYTIFTLLAGYAINHYALGDSTVLNITISILWVLWLLSRMAGIGKRITFESREDAIEYLKTCDG